jgi:hypothetical protein
VCKYSKYALAIFPAFKTTMRKFLRVLAVHILSVIDALVALPAPTFFVRQSL